MVARAFGEQIESGTPNGILFRERPKRGSFERSHGGRAQAPGGLAVRELLTVWTLGLPVAVGTICATMETDSANPEHNYGLLDSSGNEKPAMKAIRTLTVPQAITNMQA